jgi:transposase
MVMDGAGWHKSNDLKVPGNIRLVKLPPYSPELNLVENIWDEIREKYFYNKVFDSVDALENHFSMVLKHLEANPETIHFIVAWPWIVNALKN